MAGVVLGGLVHGRILADLTAIRGCHTPCVSLVACRREPPVRRVWKHGISIYGWGEGQDAGLTTRHPELSSGKGTIRITPKAAEAISDDELRALARGALAG